MDGVVGSRRTPAITIAVHGLRRLWKGALAIGITSGAVAASSGLSYASNYPTRASRLAVASGLRGATGMSVLFGQIDRIDTVGGYTAYKSYVFLTTLGAIWAMLATTRVLRGEEELGRWQLVLAGRTTAAKATRATVGAVGACLGLVFVSTSAVVYAAGRKPTLGFGLVGSAIFGAATVLAPAVFAGVAAVAAQLARTRRLATMIATSMFAAAFVLRMIGDTNRSSRWVLWTTPLGWAELVHPLTSNDPMPIVAAAGAAVLLMAAAVALASRRDVGGGMLDSRETTAVRPFGLRSTLSLAARLDAGVLAAWAAGIGAVSLVFGIVAKAAANSLAGSSTATSTLTKLGATGSGPRQYLGVVFLLTGAVLALMPAGQVAAARREEASGRLALILAGPTRRSRWLGERVALTAVVLLAFGVLAGTATWLGAVSQGVHVGLGSTVLAGLNLVPAPLLALALGSLVLAVAPRGASAAVYVVVGWSLIIDLLGSLVSGLGPLTRLSLFHYVALAPAQHANGTETAITMALAVLIAIVAVAVFGRRDLHTD